MKCFPYSLIRIGGGPYDHLESLQIHETPELLDRVVALTEKAENSRNAISESLYETIPGIQDPALQKKLLNLKRDVFNGRPLSPTKTAVLCENLPDREQVEIYVATLAEIAELETRAEELYKKELMASREVLQGLTKDENLRKGLVLSSQSLLRSCDWYARKKVKKLKKQDLKTELSLIKYLSRIYGKTSPFSTFTHLAMGSLNDGGSEEELFEGVQPEREAEGHIRVNNFLFRSLQSLMPAHPAYKAWIRIRPNPTLVREPQNYLYLTNSNNVESFQRIPLNPVLDLFWDLCAQKPEGLRFRELIEAAGEAVDASPEDLGAYVGQLLEYGFLEYNFEVSGIDPDWDVKLVAVLEQWDADQTPHLQEFIDVLKHLREQSRQYADLDSSGRITMLEEVFQRFKDVYFAIHEDAGLPEEERMTDEERRELQKQKEEEKEEAKEEEEDEEEVFKHVSSTGFSFKPEQMFYEDAALPGSYSLNNNAMEHLLSAMNRLYAQLDLFMVNGDDQLIIQDYISKHYQEPVDMLTFYEAYYRDYKKPQAENKRKQEEAERKLREAKSKEENKEESKEENKEEETASIEELEAELGTLKEEAKRFDLQIMDGLREKRRNWDAAFKEKVNFDPDLTVLRVDDVAAANAAIGHESREHRTSYALFLQPFTETMPDGSRRVQAVVNANPVGFGKLFSRFLHIFDPVFVETVRRFNRSIDEDAYLLENTDASFFNANLHPPLMPHEVWMPGGQNSLPAENQVPITEISISYDKEKDQVALSHDNKPLYVFDLGFQSIKGRSELFQLLSRFTKGLYCSYGTMLNTVRARTSSENETEPLYQPRILLDDRIVLRRRSWTFKKAGLPPREPGDTAWSWYQRVYKWKCRHGLPDDVFVVIENMRSNENLNAEQRKKLGRDDYKPQLISFRNPMMVRLFEKLVEKTPTTMAISEMLPSPKHLQQFGDNRYITELVSQWESGIDP